MLQPKRYVAVDVSVEFLRSALDKVQHEHPRLDVVGLGQDFSAGLDLPAELLEGGAPLFFYPGSSIGNFTRDEAFAFLRRIHARASGGGLLIGVDLVKPRPVLEAAYDDALGVTAAFNLNALRHLNSAIGTDFDPRQWRHVAFYDETEGRIEMHLEARQPLVVRWPGAERRFAAGERIHTENSYKYTRRRLRLAAARRRLSPAAGLDRPQGLVRPLRRRGLSRAEPTACPPPPRLAAARRVPAVA